MIVLTAQRLAVPALDLEVVRLSSVHRQLGQDQVVDPPTHVDEGRIHASDGLVALQLTLQPDHHLLLLLTLSPPGGPSLTSKFLVVFLILKGTLHLTLDCSVVTGAPARHSSDT